MTERTKLMGSVADFLSRHWGEIYTGFDILKGLFKGLSGDADTDLPEGNSDAAKGIAGLFGLRDERIFLMLLNTIRTKFLAKRGGKQKFQRLMGYFDYEMAKAIELREKLGYAGSELVLMLYVNRLRKLFDGLKDIDGKDLGQVTETIREPAPGFTHQPAPTGKKGGGPRPFIGKETVRTFQDKGPRGNPRADILEMLSDEIDRNWSALATEYKDEPEKRLEKAYELTRKGFRVAGLPRMPNAEDVPNLFALLSWAVDQGMKFAGGFGSLIDELYDELPDPDDLKPFFIKWPKQAARWIWLKVTRQDSTTAA